MRPQHIMFLGLIFTAGTLLSLTLGGAWLGDEEVGFLNDLTVFRDVNFFGLLTIAVPNISYFASGIIKLVQFDFAFFGGSLEIVKFLLIMVIGTATVWGIFTVIIIIASNLLRR